MMDHPHTSPTPSRPGHHRAVRGGLGHGGPACAHLARPAPAAPAHVSEDGGGVGARPRTAGSQPGQHHDVERGAAAFEEECFADGMPVVFQDLSYEVRHSARRRETVKLLDGVSGYLLPGQLSALMGPSGCGKTTLLDCLAGRKSVGKIIGTVRFSGHAASRTFLRRYTGYVEQADTLVSNLTVAEMLMYSAELKLPVSTSRAAKAARVDAVLEHLALSSCRDVRIGCVLARGISGGQAKRVNIGLSLLSRPRVLFLDEPTSGLDSYSANECMGVIKALTRGGITVCATIHSPTPYAFDLFDRLHLLLRGRTAFLGDNGPSVIRFFQAVFPTAPPCDEGGGAGGGGGRGGAAGLSSHGGGSGAWSGAAADWWAEDEDGGGAKKAGPPGRTASSVSSLLVTALSGVSAAAGGGATPTGGLSPAASGPLPPPHPARQPLAPPPPPSAFHNRAEWVVDLTTRADRDGRAGECAAAYATSRLAAANAARVHRLLTERSPVSETVRRELGATQATTTPAWWGVRTMLAYRTSRDYMDPDFLGPRVIDRALLSVIITTLYWKVGGNTSPGNASNITALLFLWAIMPGYSSSACMPSLFLERALFIREREDGLYRPITALVSKMVSELMIAALISTLASIPVFYACKLGGSLAVFAVGHFVTSAVGASLGSAIAALAPSMDVANAALPAYVSTLLFFVGLLLRPQDMPRWLAWYKYLNFLHFSWAAQMLNQFGGGSGGDGSGGPLSLDGVNSVLAFYDIPVNGDPWVQLGYASLFFWFFAGVAWLALGFKTHQRR